MIITFHADVCMPESMRVPIHTGRLRYGHHAREESQKDRFGSFKLPEQINFDEARLIEAEYDSDAEACVKQVWRQPLDDRRDIVLVVKPGGFVKTVWINLRTDSHNTLRRENYFR